MIFKGLSFFSGKLRDQRKKAAPHKPEGENPYKKASEELKKSAEELELAAKKLQLSFQARQETLKRLVWISKNLNNKSAAAKKPQQQKALVQKSISDPVKPRKVSEGHLFEVYREACLNFIEPNKAYYFKLRNHSQFLASLYQRHMGNLRYYDQEFRRIKEEKREKFSEFEAYVANLVIKEVNQMGREKFVKEGHQALYNELCVKLLGKSVDR
jgi:hypothetical protein